MQVTVEKLSPVTRKINIEIPAERVSAEIEKVFTGIQKKAKIQGFRHGKAPIALIRRQYNDAMQEEVMRRFYEQTLYSAFDEHKIEPVDAPTIECDPLEQGLPFKYSALVEVIPEILLNDYTGLSVKKEKYVRNPDNIEGELARMRENMAELAPLDDEAPVENGHVVSVDYLFSVEGHPEEDSNAEDAVVEIGSSRILPGFEEQLIGMKRGDQKEIRVTLPESYRNMQVAGKEGIFQVTIKEVKRKELPELDDEFAQQFGDYETMEELRTKLADYHEKNETDRIEKDLHEQVIKVLIEKNPLEVPESLVRKQLEHMLENLKKRLKSQRLSLDAMGLDEEGFRVRFRDAAEEKVKGGLLLMSLVEKENISVTDDDLERHYEKLADGNTEMLGRIKEYYSSNRKVRSSISAELQEDKAIQFLLESAEITEVDAADLKAA